MNEKEATYLANDVEQTLLTDQNQGFTQEQLDKQKELDWKARELEAVQQGKRNAVAVIIKSLDEIRMNTHQNERNRAEAQAEVDRYTKNIEKNEQKIIILQNEALHIIGGF